MWTKLAPFMHLVPLSCKNPFAEKAFSPKSTSQPISKQVNID